MDISVIIPIYGVENYIEQSLNSIVHQTKLDEVEIILVNDCTKDNSIEIAQKIISQYQHINMRIINHDVNMGLACARQTGNDAAIGDYIIHLDSDDYFESTLLENLYTRAIKSNADIVCYDVVCENKDGKRREWVNINVPENGVSCINEMFSGRMIHSIWSKLVKRELYTSNDIKWVPRLDMYEDSLICFKLFCFANNVVYLPKKLYCYRYNDQSITNILSIRSIGNMITSISEMENFALRYNLLDDVQTCINYRKLELLRILLRKCKGDVQKSLVNLYPYIGEDDINKCPHFSTYWKFAFRHLYKGNYYLYNFLDLFASLTRSLRSLF